MKLELEVVSVSVRPKNLKECRADAGITLRELSKCCGLSIGFLNDLEFRRRTCSQENFTKIAEALAMRGGK